MLDNDQARAINRVKTEAAIHSWARFPTLDGGKYGQTGGEDFESYIQDVVTSQRVSVLLTVWMLTHSPPSSRLSCAAGTLPEFLGWGSKIEAHNVLRHMGHVNAATRVIPTVRLDPTNAIRGEVQLWITSLCVLCMCTP